MRQLFRPILLAMLMLCIAAVSPEQLIQQLGDADPAVRRKAADELVRAGESVRKAVIQATKVSDPQIAESASDVLARLPWTAPDDPMRVKEILLEYGRREPSERMDIAAALVLLGEPAYPAMLRLLLEEPSQDVAWQVAALLSTHLDKTLAARVRQIDPAGVPPPALLLIGRAWQIVDIDRGMQLLKAAIAAEKLNPAHDSGMIDEAFDNLSALAESRGAFTEAADFRREQASRTSGNSEGAFQQLLALHVRHGPLPGLSQDLQTYQQLLEQPEARYALGKIFEKTGLTIAAHAMYLRASSSVANDQDRLSLAAFLMEQRWLDLADHEARICLNTPGVDQNPYQHMRIRYLLAAIAEQRSDDAAVAEQFSAILKEAKSSDTPERFAIDALEAETSWRLARAALSKNDEPAFEKHVARVLSLRPASSNIAIDLVPTLKKRQRLKEAAQLFDDAFAPLRSRLNETPEHDLPNDTLMQANLMNDLAWLCARCDEHLDEAFDFSTKAVDACPGNAAYIDTLAEVNFRRGNAAEAAKLEAQAIQLRPDDDFMVKQLARFKAAGHPQ